MQNRISKRLDFIIKSNKNKKDRNIKANNIYVKWLRFLKNKKKYSNYQCIVINYLQEEKIGYWWVYTPFLNPGTMNGLKEIIHYLDEFAYDCLCYPLNYWKELLIDFEIEIDSENRKSLLTRKLYHMDVPNIVHHEYIGSSPLRKRLIDEIIDRFLFIKRK